MEDAYDCFQYSKGRLSHEELQLERASPMNRDDDDDGCSEWPHMSDYDEYGLLFGQVGGSEPPCTDGKDLQPNANAIRMDVEVKPDCREHCDDSGPRVINVYDEIGKTHRCSQQEGETTTRPRPGDNHQFHENEHGEIQTCTANIRQVENHDVG